MTGNFSSTFQATCLALFAACASMPVAAADVPTTAGRPNIVWIIVDDMSPNFSCYGESTIQTPHVDRLAREGTRFRRAFVTAPVCSSCRSALITGCYQTTIGAHQHRSGRGVRKIHLPGRVVPIPMLFQAAGYYTCVGGHGAAPGRLGKTDYNFQWPANMCDGHDWAGRKPGQPFFMQVQLHGGKHRGDTPSEAWRARVMSELGSRTNPDRVVLPPYYPRDKVLLEDWADYLDCCRYTDLQVGAVLARLEQEGILDDTVVMFMTDHGISHARGKQFLYDEGLHVPLVMRGPGVPGGAVRDDLVEHIDLAATSLALAGIEVPDWMQGRNLWAENGPPRQAVFAARDRCDETIDHIRSVRTADFKYIRNYLSLRPHMQPNYYKDSKSIVQRLREMHAAGELAQPAEGLLFAPTRPAEELYDLAADPDELVNLAGDSNYSQRLAEMRGLLADWETRTGDLGQSGELKSMYDSDMDVYLAPGGGPTGPGREQFLRNIDWNKRMAAVEK